jgi:hypothetical protein
VSIYLLAIAVNAPPSGTLDVLNDYAMGDPVMVFPMGLALLQQVPADFGGELGLL